MDYLLDLLPPDTGYFVDEIVADTNGMEMSLEERIKDEAEFTEKFWSTGGGIFTTDDDDEVDDYLEDHDGWDDEVRWTLAGCPMMMTASYRYEIPRGGTIRLHLDFTVGCFSVIHLKPNGSRTVHEFDDETKAYAFLIATAWGLFEKGALPTPGFIDRTEKLPHTKR